MQHFIPPRGIRLSSTQDEFIREFAEKNGLNYSQALRLLLSVTIVEYSISRLKQGDTNND